MAKGIGKRLSRLFRKKQKTPAKTVSRALGRVGRAMGPLGAVMGASLAAAAAYQGAVSAHERMTRDNDFLRALGESQNLRKNKQGAYKHFMTLRRMNQTLSQDPMVAAGYMNKALSFENEGIDPSIALALTSPGKPQSGIVDPMKLATIHQKMMGEV
jgi:hypothetical protein